jgi:hypothetical protein
MEFKMRVKNIKPAILIALSAFTFLSHADVPAYNPEAPLLERVHVNYSAVIDGGGVLVGLYGNYMLFQIMKGEMRGIYRCTPSRSNDNLLKMWDKCTRYGTHR